MQRCHQLFISLEHVFHSLQKQRGYLDMLLPKRFEQWILALGRPDIGIGAACQKPFDNRAILPFHRSQDRRNPFRIAGVGQESVFQHLPEGGCHVRLDHGMQQRLTVRSSRIPGEAGDKTFRRWLVTGPNRLQKSRGGIFTVSLDQSSYLIKYTQSFPRQWMILGPSFCTIQNGVDASSITVSRRTVMKTEYTSPVKIPQKGCRRKLRDPC